MLSYRPKAEKRNEEETIMTEEILRAISSEVWYGVWFLIGAALVFWMQAGFPHGGRPALLRAKMRKYPDENLMDFPCIGTGMFILIGFHSCLVKIYWASSASPVLTSSPLT